METNGKMRTSAEPNKIYIVPNVLMRTIQKCKFYWIWATVSKVMGIIAKFTKTTHQIMVMSGDPGFRFRKFLFFA